MSMNFNVPPGGLPQPTPLDQVPQALTAAILRAAKGDCQCDVCKILRTVGDKMAQPFLQSPAAPQT